MTTLTTTTTTMCEYSFWRAFFPLKPATCYLLVMWALHIMMRISRARVKEGKTSVVYRIIVFPSYPELLRKHARFHLSNCDAWRIKIEKLTLCAEEVVKIFFWWWKISNQRFSIPLRCQLLKFFITSNTRDIFPSSPVASCLLGWQLTKHIFNIFLPSLSVSSALIHTVPQEEWFVDQQHETGTLYWRRDSSRVKFRCEVEVLEFVRSPEEMRFMKAREYVENASHPITVVMTCILALCVTVVIPWVFMSTGGIQW